MLILWQEPALKTQLLLLPLGVTGWQAGEGWRELTTGKMLLKQYLLFVRLSLPIHNLNSTKWQLFLFTVKLTVRIFVLGIPSLCCMVEITTLTKCSTTSTPS